MSDSRFEFIRCADPADLVRRVAAEWLAELSELSSGRSSYAVALSGGRSAEQFFAAVRRQAARAGVEWGRVEFFWADERCVAPDSPESNYRVARESLLLPLGIAPERIHRIRGELGARLAAQLAEVEMRTVLSVPSDQMPVLDLVLLGMGEDGHVASLFSNSVSADAAGARSYIPVLDSPKPPVQRVSLSYAAVATARAVWVLVAGPGKAMALAESLREGGDTPLARVIRSRRVTRVFSHEPVL